uniref:Uncharacterized protein n=1 Tax=Romanomermis culicivorax TaxID=13658 RepID=A0A915HP03_ROMCU
MDNNGIWQHSVVGNSGEITHAMHTRDKHVEDLSLTMIVIDRSKRQKQKNQVDSSASHDENFLPGYPFIHYPGTRVPELPVHTR